MAASVQTFFSTRRRTLGLVAAAPFVATIGALSGGGAQAAELGSTTLVLGDQAGGTRALAEAAKVPDGTPYKGQRPVVMPIDMDILVAVVNLVTTTGCRGSRGA